VKGRGGQARGQHREFRVLEDVCAHAVTRRRAQRCRAANMSRAARARSLLRPRSPPPPLARSSRALAAQSRRATHCCTRIDSCLYDRLLATRARSLIPLTDAVIPAAVPKPRGGKKETEFPVQVQPSAPECAAHVVARLFAKAEFRRPHPCGMRSSVRDHTNEKSVIAWNGEKGGEGGGEGALRLSRATRNMSHMRGGRKTSKFICIGAAARYFIVRALFLLRRLFAPYSLTVFTPS